MYPHKFQITMRIPQFREKYNHIQSGVKLDDTVQLAGRILAIRSSSKHLYFIELHAEGSYIQIMSSRSSYAGDWEIHRIIRRGDIIGVTGIPGRTERGELSIYPSTIQLLSPCLHILPSKISGLRDKEARFRQRYLDLMLNKKSRETFYTRSKIITYIRHFLDNLGFLEVETPMMSLEVGGANARPFKTYHNDLDLDMYMRIAPELYLKELVVGGLDRVYEIGKQFRNEGIDLTHNPEFTTCEFYYAYADYNDLMDITENMLSGMVYSIFNTYELQHRPNENSEPITLNFKPPFRRISMIDELERKLNTKLPRDFYNDEAVEILRTLCSKNNVVCEEPCTASRMIDKLVSIYIEPDCVQPTFITDHPEVMCPLAKYHRKVPGLTERFELFVLKKELCNAYTELNDPRVQRDRFTQQVKDKEAGDDEVRTIDEDFVLALEHALPPTGGWGLGIDRLTMFLTNTDNIKEVILFPAMRPQSGLATANETTPTDEEKQI